MGFASADGRRNEAHLFARHKRGFEEVELEQVHGPNDSEARLLGFSGNGAFALASVPGEGVCIWDTSTGKLRKLRTQGAGAATLSDDGRVFAEVHNRVLRLYDVEKDVAIGEPIQLFCDYWGPQELSFSPDGTRLLIRDQKRPYIVLFDT